MKLALLLLGTLLLSGWYFSPAAAHMLDLRAKVAMDPASGRITLRLADQYGTPVTGAIVRATLQRPAFWLQTRFPLRDEGEGTYTGEIPPPPGNATLLVTVLLREERWSAELPLPASEPSGDFDLTLLPIEEEGRRIDWRRAVGPALIGAGLAAGLLLWFVRRRSN
jgi:hypothetical protein